eukprot:jgi/Mesvir1/11253/Mv01058-RA.1
MPRPLDAAPPHRAVTDATHHSISRPCSIHETTSLSSSTPHSIPKPYSIVRWLYSSLLAAWACQLASRPASRSGGGQQERHASCQATRRWHALAPLLAALVCLAHCGAAAALPSQGGNHDLFHGFLPPWPPPGLRSIQIVMKGGDTYDTVLWSALAKDLRMVQAVALPNMAEKVVLRAFVDEAQVASLKVQTGSMVQNTRFPKELREQLQQAQAAKGGPPLKVYQSSSVALSTMALRPLVLRFTSKVPPGEQSTMYSMLLQLSRRLDCTKKQDCASRLCVRGKCVCPALVNANTDCTAGVLQDDWCLMPMQKLNTADVMRVGQNQSIVDRSATRRFRRYSKYLRMDHFTVNRGNTHAIGMLKEEPQNLPDSDIMDYADFSHCAVVGSSSVMTQPGMRARGAEIDAHTAVIRFNEAPVKGYEKYVGSKTTLRIQNPERAGFAERKGELCIYKMGRASMLPSDSLCHFFENSPQFEAYYRVLWALYRPEGAELERPKMSSGFMGVALAVHLCAKVDLYGFTHSDGYYFNKLPFREDPASPSNQDSDDSTGDGDAGAVDFVRAAPAGHPSHPSPAQHERAIGPTPRGGAARNARGGGSTRPNRPAGRKLKLIENLEDRHPWRYERLCTQKMAQMGVVRVMV